MDEATVAERLAVLRRHIAQMASRTPVAVCAVTKGFDARAIEIAGRIGCEAVGENYAQELLGKMAGIHSPHPSVHFIGRLQTNKVRSLSPVVDVWQSIDRVALIDELAKRAPGARIYVQVNATDESDKGGCALGDAPRLVAHAKDRGLRVEGLMTVGPTDGDPQRTRRAFAAVRHLADDLGLVGCSMGMSGDTDIALQEGTTMLRVGTALFGERPATKPQHGVI